MSHLPLTYHLLAMNFNYTSMIKIELDKPEGMQMWLMTSGQVFS